MRKRDRRGFTFIELLVVIMVLGILASIAVVRYSQLKQKALSVQATSEMDNVRMAAYSRFYDTGVWPTDPGPGVVPPELVAYLASGFSFVRSDYTLELENYTPPGGGPTGTYQVAVRLTSSNPQLITALANMVGHNAPYMMLGNDLVVILVGPDGQT